MFASTTRTIAYTAVDQVREVRDYTANQATRFFYGPNRERYKRVDYSDAAATIQQKRTLNLGGVEIISQNGTTEFKRYIGGVAIVTLRSNGQGSKEYLFPDHLGSTDVVTDRFGNVGRILPAAGSPYPARDVGQRMSFDAFGARRAAASWQNIDYFGKASFDTTRTTTKGY